MLIHSITADANYRSKKTSIGKYINFANRPVLFSQYEDFIKESKIDKIKTAQDINIVNNNLDTLLHISAKYNQEEICRYLLYKNLNPNQKNKYGKSPFAIACSRQNKKLVEDFLLYNPDINIQDNLYNTPLHQAVKSPNITDLLLKNNANPYLKNDFGQSPFFNSYFYPETLQIYLKNKINPNTENQNGQTLLHEASKNNNFQVIDLLKKYKGDINYKDKDGKSPIFYINNLKTLDYLIKNGALINQTDKVRQSILHKAVLSNNLKYTKALLQRNANPNIKDINNLQPIAYAQTLHMLELLLRANSTPDVIFPNSSTLLHKYSQNNNVEAIYLLTEHGANPNIVNKNGDIAFDLTTNSDIKTLLLAAGSDPNHKAYLNDALKKQDDTLFDNLLECGANPNKTDEFGNSSVFYIDNEDQLEKLIKHGTDINLYNNQGFTPMLHFALLGDKQKVELIKKYGATDLKASNGDSIADCLKKHEIYGSWLKKSNKIPAFKGLKHYEYGSEQARRDLNYKTVLTKDTINRIIVSSDSIDKGLIEAYKKLVIEEQKIYTAMQSLPVVIKHFQVMIKEDINKIANMNPSGSKIPIIGILKQYADTVLTDDFINKIHSEGWNIKTQYEEIITDYENKIKSLINEYAILNNYLAEGIKYVNYINGETETRNKLLSKLDSNILRCSEKQQRFINSLNKTSEKYENLVNTLVNLQKDKQNKRTAKKTVIKIITLGMS